MSSLGPAMAAGEHSATARMAEQQARAILLAIFFFIDPAIP
jgi:hypothetical protein